MADKDDSFEIINLILAFSFEHPYLNACPHLFGRHQKKDCHSIYFFSINLLLIYVMYVFARILGRNLIQQITFFVCLLVKVIFNNINIKNGL